MQPDSPCESLLLIMISATLHASGHFCDMEGVILAANLARLR